MQNEQKKKFISTMLLYCLVGDINTRINYGGILISRIEEYLVQETILNDPNHSYLIRILTAVDKVVESSLLLKNTSANPANILSEMKKIIVEKVFVIDDSWAGKDALVGITSLGDLADIRIARSYFYASLDHYPSSTLSAVSAAEAIKNMDRAMQKIVDICDHYDLIEFEANEWRENVSIAKEGIKEEDK